ncbi:uncharacterized protein LOC127279599 [Leptopilina boulardi]|uniref:uncharacterized protein LOC127279599 n=1 Tax=Leptopilina boulardi TaxID=63433 RepID=UPI0021F62DE9|nr:uncharacterized protein LOC127279599 [Leptopilina boulardi]
MTVRYGQTMPFVWSLMERKSTRAYAAVFREIKRLLPELVINECMIDYEKALKKAIREEFPGADIHGCHFHFCKTNVKYACHIGLKVYLKNNAEARHVFLLLLALPLLPANQTRDAFDQIKANMPQAIQQTMNRFLQYFEREWFRIVTPNVFSVFGLIRRTNNCLEAYHHTLINKFGAHPNIWMFTSNTFKILKNY